MILVDSPLGFKSSSKPKPTKHTSLGMDEASTAIKQLDLPKNIRTSGLMSSHDVANSEQLQTEMDFVNKKIDKAK